MDASQFPDLGAVVSQFIIPVIAGGAITAIAQWTKKSGWSSRAVILLCAAILSVGITAFNTFVPPDLRVSIVNFLALAVTSCWSIYEFIIRVAKEGGMEIKHVEVEPVDGADGVSDGSAGFVPHEKIFGQGGANGEPSPDNGQEGEGGMRLG